MPTSSRPQNPTSAEKPAEFDKMESREVVESPGEALESLDRSTVSQQVPALRLLPPKIYLNGRSIPVNVRILLTRAMERRAALISTHDHRFPSRKPQVQQDPRCLQVPPFSSRASAKASHPAVVRKSTNVRGEEVPQSLPELLANLLSKLPLQDAPRFMQLEVRRLSEASFYALGTLSAREAAELRSSLQGPYDALAYLVKHDPDTPFWDDIETILTSLPRQTFVTLAHALKVVFESQILVSKQMDLAKNAKDLLATITRVSNGDNERSEMLDLFSTLEALEFISTLEANAQTAEEP